MNDICLEYPMYMEMYEIEDKLRTTSKKDPKRQELVKRHGELFDYMYDHKGKDGTKLLYHYWAFALGFETGKR